jgi:hypothetical protein
VRRVRVVGERHERAACKRDTDCQPKKRKRAEEGGRRAQGVQRQTPIFLSSPLSHKQKHPFPDHAGPTHHSLMTLAEPLYYGAGAVAGVVEGLSR